MKCLISLFYWYIRKKLIFYNYTLVYSVLAGSLKHPQFCLNKIHAWIACPIVSSLPLPPYDIEDIPITFTSHPQEASQARASSHQLEERLSETTRDAAEMQDFLAAEARALADSLRDAEAQLADAHQDLAQRYDRKKKKERNSLWS